MFTYANHNLDNQGAMSKNNMLGGTETFLTLSRLFRDRSLCGSSDPLGNLVPCPGMLYLKIGKLEI
jgi:hypothetical protein